MISTNLSLEQVVKVADFGVARVQAQTGVMTAETGTYRWMAPEVCKFITKIDNCLVDTFMKYLHTICFMLTPSFVFSPNGR